MKVALVHDWLTGMRGGEKCLEVFCRLFPDADIFTLVHKAGSVSPTIENHRIHTSFLQSFPYIGRTYRYYLPLMPFAIRKLDLSGYDFILSSSHAVAKGIRVPEGSSHICFCHTPMRYLWDRYADYFGRHNSGLLTSWTMRLLAPALRLWDVRSNSAVDCFIANSHYVQKRIEQYYDRSSTVIHPPVDDKFYAPMNVEKGDFFLIVSALSPYKRVDLAVEAFNELGYPLVVVGEGPLEQKLSQSAGSNIRFTGWLSDAEVRLHYARCRALIFCGEEDFGITPLEAQAMGRPVVAYGRGGVLETILPDRSSWTPETGIALEKTTRPTGVFFHRQSADSLVSAVKKFETLENRFEPAWIRRHAIQFGLENFSKRVRLFIEERLQSHRC